MSWSSVLLDNRPLVIVACVACAVAAGLELIGYPVFRFVGFRDVYELLFLSAAVALVLRILVLRLQVEDNLGRFQADSREGWRRAWSIFGRDYLSGSALVRGALALILSGFLTTLFLGWKHLIPTVVPFYLDPYLERWSAILHGGRPLYSWLAELNSPLVARLFDQVYYLVNWLPVIGFAWVATSRHSLRNRFLIATVVVWFGLGSVVATLLSSAGPIYAAPSYAAQEEYLRALPDLITPKAWDLLLEVHQNHGALHPYAAISAMPSIHVAMPALFLVAGTARYPRLKWPLTWYLILTLLSTVYLGWHYALDGYVSILAVLAYWRISRPKAAVSLPAPGTIQN
jgi:hypothetical protein